MQILHETECWEWCREHGIALLGDDPDSDLPIQLAPHPDMPLVASLSYRPDETSGRERAVARAAIRTLGDADECLVWITLWGIWPSTEDWPRFYAWRGRHGMRRSLDDSPGHQFGAADRAELEALLTQILESAWDATLLVAHSDFRIVISHDEWIEVRSPVPVQFVIDPNDLVA